MNIEQIQVINHLYGPAAVLAGAGTGKTATLIERIKLLSTLVTTNRIVMLTFTNAAADEMKFRASKINDSCKHIIACTYHKFCGNLLRKYGEPIGISPFYEILVNKKYQTLIEYVKSSNEYYETLKDFPSASKLDTIFSTLINNEDTNIYKLISGTTYSQYADDIMNLYNSVKEYSLKNQKLNFDDILVYTNKLLENSEICRKIATSYDFFMVDEFQDTNALQLDILLKLSKYNKNIVVVGDISQSIYKFRGARVDNIDKFIGAFEDCKTYKLSLNYRSTTEILNAINSIMNHNVSSWHYTNMVSNIEKTNNYPNINIHRNDTEQVHWIIQKIYNSLKKGYTLNDIAIIERTSMSSFKLENELLKARIPFEKRGGKKFTDYACVDDMISFLSITVKNDKFNWFTILKLIPGIGNKTAVSIAEHCFEDNFLKNYKKRKYNDDLLLLEYNINKFSTYDFDKLFDEIANYYFKLRQDKIDHSKMSSSARFDAEERLSKDKEIIQILKDMSSDYNDVQDFLNDIALDSISTNDDTNKLIITTIHSAKGLEWPIVILLDYIDKDMTDTEEELRCLYVALTRAKTDLIISIPKFSIVNGKLITNRLNRFFNGSEPYFNMSYD